MKKIFVLALVAFSFATPAFAQVASTTATSTAPTSGGHAPEAVMQTLLSPEGFQIYLAGKNQTTVVAPKQADQISLIKQLITLLQRMIEAMNAGN